MNYAEIKYIDVANGPGIRTSLFVSGCNHHCKGCFNEVAWDFNYGKVFDKKVEDEILESLAPEYVDGITLLGGEPLEKVNQEGLLPLVKRIKETYPKKNIWLFTGFLFDKDVMRNMLEKWDVSKELIPLIDVVVDGKFDEELKDLNLKFKGSSNQRTIDVQETLKKGCICLLEEYN